MSYIRAKCKRNCKKGYCLHCGYCNNCECKCHVRTPKKRKTRQSLTYDDSEDSTSTFEDQDLTVSSSAKFERLLDLFGKKKEHYKNIPSKKER